MIENIRLSFQGIWGHKMRSFLTMLGIIIGIAAIIAIVSTIKGTNEQIKESLIGSGDNLVSVSTKVTGYEVLPGNGYDMSHIPVYDESILESLRAEESIADATMFYKKEMWEGVYYQDNTLSMVSLIGCKEDYLKLNNYRITAGRAFVERDFKEFKNVTILDRDTAYSLFNGEDPIGKTIEVKGYPFTVIGVIEKPDDAVTMNISSIEEYYTYYGYENASKMFVPDSVWPMVSSFDEPYQFVVKAASTDEMSAAGKAAEDILNAGIHSSSNDGAGESKAKYQSEDTLQKAKELQKLASSTSNQLIWIAGISLLVGGIGVMNIMLVSVTERTREIGLKKALGARRKVILGQFLTEAAVLTSLGGILGVGGGIGLAYFISKVASVPVAISMPAIAVSVAFSMLIGIVFGLIPSIKASKLDPIDALRYE